MSGGFNNPLVGGGGALVYPSIHSPNFVAGSAGWSINKDGTAEFNNVVIRNGQVISGTNLYYNGTPAFGNLVASVSAAAGTDTFGNAYLAGITSYKSGATYTASQANAGQFSIYTAPGAGGPWTLGPSMLDNGGNLLLQAASGADVQMNQLLLASGGIDITAGGLTVSGSPITATAGTAANPTLITTDTWQAMPAMANLWTIGGSAKYRLTPLGDLQVAFNNLTPGTDVDGTLIWAAGTFAAPYLVPHAHRVACYTDVLRNNAGIFDGAALEFEISGSVQCFGFAAAATRGDLYATIPLSQ